MSEEYDETDEELTEEMDNSEKLEEEEEKPKKLASKQLAKPQQKQTKQIRERYVPMHIPEVIAIKDNLKEGEESIVAEGFKDVGVAMAMAKVMNDLDKVITAGGY